MNDSVDLWPHRLFWMGDPRAVAIFSVKVPRDEPGPWLGTGNWRPWRQRSTSTKRVDGWFRNNEPHLRQDAFATINRFVRWQRAQEYVVRLGGRNVFEYSAKDAADVLRGLVQVGRLAQPSMLQFSGRGLWAFWLLRDEQDPSTTPFANADNRELWTSLQREATLAYEQSGGSQPPAIVSSATYEPFGPLSSVTLGNGLTETRLFDARYFPAAIQVPGRLDWNYTVDAVGNPLQISDVLTPSQSRTYGYQDPQYFLTQGDGPWGTRSWTYDRIGNRPTETHGALTDTYGYNGSNPRLQTVTLPGGAGTKYFGYDAAGNQIQDSRPDNELQFTYDAAGRLTRLGEVATDDAAARLVYDGRGFLREARQDLSLCAPLLTQATYTSEGVLAHRAQRNALAPAAPPLDEAYIFYFAGRPVAILKGNVPATLTSLVVQAAGGAL